MIFAAYFILAFLFLQTMVAFANLLFREKLKERKVDVESIKLSVLIPTRDEEKNIANILSDLVEANENISEILVYNDHSIDKTAEIIADFARRDSRVKLILPQPLPKNWLGKNFACYQLALHAVGDYFLFADADIRVKKTLITKSLQYTDYYNIGLLSIFPKQQMRSFAEKITVPNMHYILLSLLVLPLVRLAARFSSLSAANGQFMLFKSDVYRRLSPHSTFKNSRAEDIEIARYLKRKGEKVSCITGISEVTCRMYRSLNEAVGGFSKNVVYFFGKSNLVAILFWLMTTLGFILVWMVLGIKGVLWAFAAQLATRIFVSIHSRQNVIENICFMPFQQLTLGIFILNSLLKKTSNKMEWKGRKI